MVGCHEIKSPFCRKPLFSISFRNLDRYNAGQGIGKIYSLSRNSFRQEIIMVREWILYIGPLTKVIRLNLFLDIVPSSSAEYHALRKCFLGGSVFVVWFQNKGKPPTRNLRLSNILSISHRNLSETDVRSPAQTVTAEWTAEKCLDKRVQSKQTRKHKL